jgi:hypothetical protein
MKQFIRGIFAWSDNAFKNRSNLDFYHKFATNDSIDVDCKRVQSKLIEVKVDSSYIFIFKRKLNKKRNNQIKSPGTK